MKCDVCGKFRRLEDLARSDHGDTVPELATECRWCMSEADRGRFGLPFPVDGEDS